MIKFFKDLRQRIKKTDQYEYDKKQFSVRGTKLLKYKGKQDKVEVPDFITVIANNAFDKKKVVEVILPVGLLSIGNEAFEDCKSLRSILLPSTLNSIGEEAFENCKSLKTVIIPSSVKYIAKEAFSGLTKEQTIIVEGGLESSQSFSRSWLSGCRAEVIYK